MNGHGPSTLQVSSHPGSAGVELRVVGEMDIATAHHLVGIVRSLSELDRRSIRLDLGQLGFIDASGLSGLLEIRQLAVEQGGRLTLRNVRPLLGRLLAITHLGGQFEFERAAGPVGDEPADSDSAVPDRV